MQSNNSKTNELVLTAMFVAIIVILAFTPLGIIPLLVISATTIHIPVIIGSIFLGPKKGAFLGATFGVCSAIKNSMGQLSMSAFAFSPVAAFQLLPHDTVGEAIVLVFKSLFIAIVPRIAIGIVPYFVYVGIKKVMDSNLKMLWASIINIIISSILGFGVYELLKGLITAGKIGNGVFCKVIVEGKEVKVEEIYQAGELFPIIIGAVIGILLFVTIEFLFSKRNAKTLAFTTAGVTGSLTNTFLVMGSIFVLYNEPYAKVLGVKPSGLMAAIGAIISFNGVIEALVATILVYAIGTVLDKIRPAGVYPANKEG